MTFDRIQYAKQYYQDNKHELKKYYSDYYYLNLDYFKQYYIENKPKYIARQKPNKLTSKPKLKKKISNRILKQKRIEDDLKKNQMKADAFKLLLASQNAEISHTPP